MRLAEWFDPKNPEHLKAYKWLNIVGSWPPAFYKEMIAAGVKIETGWSYGVASKLADAYIAEKVP
jgi:hypothetical protein